jgi:serine/threonine protein kinase
MSDRPTDPLAMTVDLKAGVASSGTSSDGAPFAQLSTGVLHVGGPTKEVVVPIPVQVPGYEIIEEIGRGGMGVVYKARQKGLNRVVALKMILAGSHAGDDDRARFRIEAEAVARLQHPNIVQVYEVDEYEGKPFLSLEYCPHGALDSKLGAKPLPPKKAAALVETLARAMQTAHDAGVIHRDLKPANILLVSGGVVSGQTPPLTPHHSPLTNPRSPTSVWPRSSTSAMGRRAPAWLWVRRDIWRRNRPAAIPAKWVRPRTSIRSGRFCTSA